MTTLADTLTITPNRQWPSPGVYRGVSFDTYAALDAAHATALKCLATSSPAHYQWEKSHRKETPALFEGRALHHYLLEPDTFWKHYTPAGQCAATKRDGEPCEHPGKVYTGKWWCGQHAKGKGVPIPCDPVSQDLQLRLQAMHAAVWANPTAADLLEPAGRETELSLVWRDAGTGTLCKARLDALRPDDLHIVDLKKLAGKATEDGFAAAVRTYGYHLQAAWYERAAKACLGPGVYRFTFIGIEDDSNEDLGGPHGVQTFMLDDETMEAGRLAAQSALEVYAACQQAGTWPGYSPVTKIVGIGRWAVEREKRLNGM